MHQQLRVPLGTASAIQDGSGAMAVVPVEVDPVEVPDGALFRLLDLLAGEGYNLRFAGGSAIETGGELVFGVDDDGDEDRATKCAAFLARNGYRDIRVVEPFMCEVDDKVGALRDCLKQLASEGRRIDEVFVGTPRKGKIPVQITTIKNVAQRSGDRKGQTRGA
jgi:hypothetical protein